jgi:hypothetical protein
MKTHPPAFAAVLLLAVILACSIQQPVPTPTPTLPVATATLLFSATPPTTASATSTVAPSVLPTLPAVSTPQFVCPVPASTSDSDVVILVQPGDVLNIRSAPGANHPVVGSYAPGEVFVVTTGASADVDGARWLQVCDASGMVGWVNGKYLTEFVLPGHFCAEARVTSLLDNFQTALATQNGELLASLVSPTHGMDVWLWNSGKAVNFDAEHARWVFESAYIHNWGAHPASGMETSGTFHDEVLPELQDTFIASAERRCNDPAISSYGVTWPAAYANVNFYQVYRPGTPGIEMDWNAWLVGVEYVNGNPYIFALIHFIWTP